jgi:hypothetical protein
LLLNKSLFIYRGVKTYGKILLRGQRLQSESQESRLLRRFGFLQGHLIGRRAAC